MSNETEIKITLKTKKDFEQVLNNLSKKTGSMYHYIDIYWDTEHSILGQEKRH